MNDLKHQILSEIESHSEVFRQISPEQYRIRCPICGDSQKNPRDAHCYIKCSTDPTEPLLYMCFKCNSSGRVNRNFLSKIGVPENLITQVDHQRYNKIGSVKSKDINIITGDPVMNSPQVRYVTQRLGSGFTEDDFRKFKIIWNIENLSQYVPNQRIRNTLPSNLSSISFLSDDKAMMLSRTFVDGSESQWRKIKIYPSTKSFYTIAATIDLFTKDPIIVNIAEGIFDILSVYKNFNEPNSVFIATLSSNYLSAVEYMISKGLVGKNIILRIYIDNGIDERSLRYQLKRYKWIVGSITVYRNLVSKDVGVPLDQIELVSTKIM